MKHRWARMGRFALVGGLIVTAAGWGVFEGPGGWGGTASAFSPAGRTGVPAPGAPASPAPAITFAPTGTEYLTFWSGHLRVFAHRDNTEVTLINIADGSILPLDHPRIDSTNQTTNPFTLALAGDSFEGVGGIGFPDQELQVRIEATEPVTVWTGYLNDMFVHPDEPPDDTTSNPWGSYIPAFGESASENGREIGREFLGFTTRELRIIALIDPSAPTSIRVDDIATNTDTDSDDNFLLTSADADYADSEIQVFELDGFEDDTVHVTSNVRVTVLAGFALSSRSDWTITPPSYGPDDDGTELGTLFYVFVQRSLTVFPTQDDTTVTITDLSDGDDSNTIFLAEGDTVGEYHLFTPTIESVSAGDIIPRTADPAVTIFDNGGDPFDNDLVKVSSDKPVLVYIGPVGSDTSEFADVAYSIETAPSSRIVYCYAQNLGGSNDLQIFGFDPDTEVRITSLSFTAGFHNTGHHDFDFGPGVSRQGGWVEGVGTPSTDVWWGAGVWNGEMLRIQSNKPITVLNGDYDSPHFGAFVPFVLANRTSPPIAVATADALEVCPGQPVTLDGTQSADRDAIDGGLTPRHEWDFDIAVDSSGDGITGNDLDASGDVVTTSYVDIGPHTAQLTFFDDDGESDTDVVTVTVTDEGCVCPHSQGYWKNHKENWPVTGLLLGAEMYDQAELLALLRARVRGDASLILAKQLIGAKLNIESGADPAPASAAIAAADAIYSGFAGKLPYRVKASSPIGHDMTAEAAILDAYNNRDLTPNCSTPPVLPSRRGGGDRPGAVGACAGVTAGPMAGPDIFGVLLPYLMLGLLLGSLRLLRRALAAVPSA